MLNELKRKLRKPEAANFFWYFAIIASLVIGDWLYNLGINLGPIIATVILIVTVYANIQFTKENSMINQFASTTFCAFLDFVVVLIIIAIFIE